MDTSKVRDALIAFAKGYKTELHRLSLSKSQLLEIGSLAMCAEHYRLAGYEVSPNNLQKGVFRVKLGSRGYPWNFSWFECARDGRTVEIHSNLSVYSQYRMDEGVYVVDVGVCKGGVVPRSKTADKWYAIENHALVTFAEAKRLVIYPMLLAQFIGIVREITPVFLEGSRPTGFSEAGHFDPALLAVGYLHATARKIAFAYHDRGYLVRVVPNMEAELSRLRRRGRLTSSVLGREDRNGPDLRF